MYFGDGVFPSFQQNLQLCIELSSPFAFSYRPDDDAEVLGLNALDQLFQTCTFFTAFDLRRDGDAVVKWDQYQIAPGETEFAGETRSLGVDGLFDNLYEYLLSYLQRVGDTAVFLQLRLYVSLLDRVELLTVAYNLFQVFLVRVKLTSQVKIMQEGNAFRADIDEAGIKARHQFFNLCYIDVTNRERHGALLFLVFYQFLVFEQGNRYVFWLDIDDYFTCHYCKL